MPLDADSDTLVKLRREIGLASIAGLIDAELADIVIDSINLQLDATWTLKSIAQRSERLNQRILAWVSTHAEGPTMEKIP